MEQSDFPEITVDELGALREKGVFVLDVRQPDEYRDGHVPGAVLVPLDQLGGRLAEVPREEPVYVICRTGSRSALATRALVGAGYDATNVAGGTEQWIAAGGSVAYGDAAG
jgi:rhodanese-related sulfurtransferase